MFLISSRSSSYVCVNLLLLSPSVMCSQLSCSSFGLLLSPSVVVASPLAVTSNCTSFLQQLGAHFVDSNRNTHHSCATLQILALYRLTFTNLVLQFRKHFHISVNPRPLRGMQTPYTFIIITFQMMKHLIINHNPCVEEIH